MKHLVQIPWKDRGAYLRITLATLEEAARGRNDVHVIIFNDGSEEFIPTIVDDCTWLKTKVVDLPKTDCHRNYVSMLNMCFDEYDVDHVINIDSDACVHPDLFTVIDKMLVDCEDFGHASLFNWDSHPEDQNRYKEIYIQRTHSSFFCSMIRRQAWQLFTPPSPGQVWRFGCADGMFSTFVHESTPYSVYSTVRSYAENIGTKGTHAGESGDGKSNTVRARRFYP